VFVRAQGVFEGASFMIGLQPELEATLLEPEALARLFDKIAWWTTRYIDNLLELGADVIHVSDDYGTNDSLLFSPRTFAELVVPFESIITAHARKRGARLSLHSDGCIWEALDQIVAMGFEVVHPIQKSANMDCAAFKARYGGRLGMYGGLDVRTTLGYGRLDDVRREITYTMAHMKPGGGFIFCTSHTPMAHCSVDELVEAYDFAYELARY
jgi:uroporphyrinogen decarboxylase